MSSSPQVIIYRPNQRHELGLIHTWAVMSRNVWNARELIWQLFKRDFFAQYKKSFLGATWIFVSPVVGILSWVFLQITGVLRPGDVGIPYPAYVLVGTSMWGLFLGLFYAAEGTLQAGKELILQVNYPHEAMLFKQVGQQLANFCITLALNLGVLILLRIFRPQGFEITFPNWGLLLFPFVILPLFFLASAMGLVVAMIHVVAVDISRFFALGMGFMMYLTPIIYSTDTINNPISLAIIRWNPLTYLVCSARDVLIYGHLYQHNYTAYFISAGLSFLAFLVSWRLFYVSEGQLVERMV
jgi:lipopolysaccharide transport system permease protein